MYFTYHTECSHCIRVSYVLLSDIVQVWYIASELFIKNHCHFNVTSTIRPSNNGQSFQFMTQDC